MSAGGDVQIALPQPFGPGAIKLAFVEGQQILVVNVDGTLRAIANSCPHAGASLFGGKLVDGKIRCPAHGLLIDLATGCAGDGSLATRSFAVREVEGGAVLTIG